MRVLGRQPSLVALQHFVNEISHYPISAEEAVKFTRKSNIDSAITRLLSSFRKDEYFLSKEDLLTRTEQVRFLNIEEQTET